ncbi:hypothetical protein WA026_000401 [Henosepilachna vigintioctopunctata]|uniref:Uncharacterized protein n=1 Tax=Henosepilachna vigintioctopunctata TaxID=420089 RepID=A0AAW1UXG1_9CUCU
MEFRFPVRLEEVTTPAPPLRRCRPARGYVKPTGNVALSIAHPHFIRGRENSSFVGAPEIARLPRSYVPPTYAPHSPPLPLPQPRDPIRNFAPSLPIVPICRKFRPSFRRVGRVSV